ncbi:hypothetical protein ABZP36_008156 [Zizania latifolia]
MECTKVIPDEFPLTMVSEIEEMVDEPSCSTPRRRQIDLPRMESIEQLRTPDYNELLRSFRESRGSWKKANGDMKHFLELQELRHHQPQTPGLLL